MTSVFRKGNCEMVSKLLVLFISLFFLSLPNFVNCESFFVSKNQLTKETHISNVEQSWKLYKEKYDYSFNEKEDEERRQIFAENLAYIRKHQKENMHRFSLEMNPTGHLREDELHLCYKPSRNNSKNFRNDINDNSTSINGQNSKLPVEVDWRKLGVVTRVKDQGQCGSCYAFSAIGALESMYSMETGKFADFSPQEIVDCSNSFGNNGCNGGLMENVFRYVKEFGIELDKSYPYHAEDDECKRNVSASVLKITSFRSIPSGNEEALQRAIAFKGPISVGIDAGSKKFRFYKEGVYHDDDCSNSESDLNHGVLAVGYGTLHDEEYYIVKNSWSTSWGNNGYILMSRNKDNNCGIATAASYPIF